MNSTQPTVLCAWCGHVIRQGGLVISHGMCDGCAELVLAIIDSQDGTPVSPPIAFPVRLPRAG